MKTIKLEIELEYDDELQHFGDSDEECKKWFYDHVLGGENNNLVLSSFYSKEHNYQIGKVKISKVYI
jgi:hypothetical protein